MQAERLLHGFADEEGVEIFQIGEAHELGGVSLVADIAFLVRIRVAPVLCGFPEECHVQDIGLAGIDQVGLFSAKFGGDEVGADGVGMDAVVDLGEVPLHIPAEFLLLGFLEALEFLDQVELEFHGHP